MSTVPNPASRALIDEALATRKRIMAKIGVTLRNARGGVLDRLFAKLPGTAARTRRDLAIADLEDALGKLQPYIASLRNLDGQARANVEWDAAMRDAVWEALILIEGSAGELTAAIGRLRGQPVPTAPKRRAAEVPAAKQRVASTPPGKVRVASGTARPIDDDDLPPSSRPKAKQRMTREAEGEDLMEAALGTADAGSAWELRRLPWGPCRLDRAAIARAELMD